MFYGCHRAQKQQEHAHTDQTVLLSLFFGMRRAYYHANEQTRALVNHCVFTVRTSAVGAEGGRKRRGENRARPKHRPVEINILGLLTLERARGVVFYTLQSPFKHWESLQFYLNLFHKEQIQFESCFPALGREKEPLLLPEGTIKYLCSVSCSFQGPHVRVTSESDH